MRRHGWPVVLAVSLVLPLSVGCQASTTEGTGNAGRETWRPVELTLGDAGRIELEPGQAAVWPEVDGDATSHTVASSNETVARAVQARKQGYLVTLPGVTALAPGETVVTLSDARGETVSTVVLLVQPAEAAESGL